MRLSTIASVAVASAPLLVSAKGQFGWCLGVRHSDGSCKTTDDYNTEFKQLGKYGSVVRTYSAVDKGDQSGPTCYVPSAILPAAIANNIQVVLGIWPDTVQSFKDDMAEVLKNVQYSKAIMAVTVGSETLYRNQQNSSLGLTPGQLNQRIADFKSNATKAGLNVDDGTAESWNKFQDGTADSVIPNLDIALVNAFGYWQSQDISNASATYRDDLAQAYQRIQDISKSTTKPKLWNGETGWPTDGGDNYHDPKVSTTAVAGTKNAQYFYTNGVCSALDWDYNVFYFEAYAEPWKLPSLGADGSYEDETHWGAFDAQGNLLLDLSCTYKDL